MWSLSDYPLAEEIGDPNLFVGREREMKRLLRWAEDTKPRRVKSMAILSRRKKGKTALLQRFYNILYMRDDPQLIPFYYRIPENVHTKLDFTRMFYRRVLTQYFAFTTRTEEWVSTMLPMPQLKELAAGDPHLTLDIQAMEEMLENEPTAAWPFAQEVGHRISQWRDVRILQILDEFQYMNKYIVSDDDPKETEFLCHSYMGAAESKYSPQIVAGSYIGWLEAILRHLTARHRKWRLGSLSDAEALEAVYNYASIYRVTVTEETAPYIAEVCYNDPFYIAATISNQSEVKDLTTEAGVRDALTYETVIEQGEIADVWGEYLAGAFDRINEINCRRIVLYLAKHEPEERDRDQIRKDLNLKVPHEKAHEKTSTSWSWLTSWPRARRTSAIGALGTASSPWSSAGSTAKRSTGAAWSRSTTPSSKSSPPSKDSCRSGRESWPSSGCVIGCSSQPTWAPPWTTSCPLLPETPPRSVPSKASARPTSSSTTTRASRSISMPSTRATTAQTS